MKKALFLIVALILAGCASAPQGNAASEPTATLTSLPTETPTPAPPTLTPTPTLEPMITDVSAWKQEVMKQAMAKGKYTSYEAYLAGEMTSSPDYDADVMQYSFSEQMPFDFAAAEGKAEASGKVAVTREYLLKTGIDAEHILLMSFDKTIGPTEVVGGVYINGKFVPIITHVIGEGGKIIPIETPEDLDKLAGKFLAVEVVNKISWYQWIDMKNPSANWSKLEEMPNSGLYRNIMELRSSEERKALETLLYDPTGYAATREIEVYLREQPADFPGSALEGSDTLALLSYMISKGHMNDDIRLIPFQVGVDRSSFFGQ